jgi:putative tricarboxylic transport membrane protein
MKVGDFFMGLVLLGLSVGVFVYARTLPNPVRQPYGPGAFPSLIAVLLGIAALVLIWQAWRRGEGRFEIRLAPWARDPRALFRFLLVPAAVLFYIYFVRTLGFLPTTALIMLVLLLSLRVSSVTAVANALVIPLAVHTAFYVGLGVQLPWGLLAPIRW